MNILRRSARTLINRFHEIGSGRGTLTTEYYRGDQNVDGQYALKELPKYTRKVYGKALMAKYRPEVSNIIFDNLSRSNQSLSQSTFLLRTAENHFTYVTGPFSKSVLNHDLEKSVNEKIRGFALQIILEGKGVRAWFEKNTGDLFIREGFGSAPKNISSIKNKNKDVNILITESPNLIIVKGMEEKKVEIVARKIVRHFPTNPFTGKGAHIAFDYVKRLTPAGKR